MARATRKWCTRPMHDRRKLVVFSRVTTLPELPIDAVLPAVREALRGASSVVLQAPPGAGKTTRVPLALLGEPWLAGRAIVMLEPRRLAARAAARYMAGLLGEPVGATVGYRVRLDSRVSAATRIEVVTEGILTRRLQDDPGLDGVGLVIFDEFHERSLAADLGLALTLQARAVLREDLRVLVMSATLHGAPVAALLGGAPTVTSEGRAWPVETRYVPPRPGVRLDAAVAGTVRDALGRDAGDVLVFLPGAGEIRRVEALLTERSLDANVTIAPLFGNLPADAQDRAILPSPPGRRKVVLATPIAETSLTIEGVRVVVDAGLSRVPRFSPRSGMTRLETVRVSRAGADQRCGRAGRTQPGVCYRLWSAGEQAALLDRAVPEILAADLAPLALDLALAGVVDPLQLHWLDPPPAAALAQARELLVELGALDAASVITAHGRAMAALGVHPRVAHMLLAGRELGAASTACALAALLEERDVLRVGSASREADVRLRLRVLSTPAGDHDARVDRGRLYRVRDRTGVLRSLLDDRGAGIDEGAAGWLLALAYPDRVARRRGMAGRYLMRNGSGARLDEGSALSTAPWLSVAETDGQRPEARIFLAAPLDQADVERLFGTQVVREHVVEWQRTSGVVAVIGRERLGALVLREDPMRDVDEEEVARVLLDAIDREDGVQLRWGEAARRVRERVAFVRRLEDGWPDWSDAALHQSMSVWLLPHLVGMQRRTEVESLDLASILLAQLSFAQRKTLDRVAPSHVEVPTGSRVPVDYSDPDAAFIAVRLQELFGLAETPRVGDGRVPLMLHLLSPAGRPVQVTRDLAGFWRSSYFDVRRELRGRYPKHEWPEDPLSAPPTRRAKRRS